MNKWSIALVLIALASLPAHADDTKDRLAASARSLIERADALLGQPDLPLEGKRAVEAGQAWIETAEEARKRRNFAQASRGQDNAALELDIADAHLRAAQLAVLKRELDAVVQELTDRIETGEGGS